MTCKGLNDNTPLCLYNYLEKNVKKKSNFIQYSYYSIVNYINVKVKE